MTPKELFLANLDTIRSIVAFVADRRHLSGDQRDDFESYVRLRIMEEDYRVFRRFRGESQISTYLSVVIQRFFLDYRTQEWGKWRPSAAARRLGAVGMQLERLLYRDRLTLHEATEVLVRSHKVRLSEAELERMYLEIPVREDSLVLGEGALEAADPSTPPRGEGILEERSIARETQEILDRALAELPAQDRLILRLHLVDEIKIVEIARLLGLKQTPLYPRIRKIYLSLRHSLEEAGIGRDEVKTLLRSHFRLDLDLGEEDEKSPPRPSREASES